MLPSQPAELQGELLLLLLLLLLLMPDLLQLSAQQ
jgi:hypothetical protein